MAFDESPLLHGSTNPDMEGGKVFDPHGTSLACLKPGGVASSTWLLASIALGLGVFGQPAVFVTIGWFMGIVLLAFFASLTAYSQYLMLAASEGNYEEGSYGGFARQTLGKFGLLGSSFFNAITCIIGNAAHMSVVSTLLHDISTWYYTGSSDYPFSRAQQGVTICILLTLVSPFCLASSLQSLRHISTLSVTTSAILSISMTILSFSHIAEHGTAAGSEAVPAFVAADTPLDTFKAILRGSAAICFAYSGIVNLPGVTKEMRPVPKSAQEAGKPVIYSTIVCFIVYTMVSVSSVLAYGTACSTGNGDVLYLVSPDNLWVTFWCLALVGVITLLYPVINFPAVSEGETVINLLLTSSAPGTAEFDQEVAALGTSRLFGGLYRNKRAALSLLYAAIVIGIDMFVKDLGSLFGLCGGLGLSMVSMILPALMYLAAFRGRHSRHTIGAVCVLVVGITILFGSTISIIEGLVKK